MSVQAFSWVMEKSESRLAARLTLMSIANHCDSAGENSFPSVARIAREARISEREVQRSLRILVELQELSIGFGQGPKGVHMYSLCKMTGDNLSPITPDKLSPMGVTNPTGGVTNPPKRGDKLGHAIRNNRHEPSLKAAIIQNITPDGALATWLKAKQELKTQIPAEGWNLWLRPMYLLKELSDGCLLFSLPPVKKIVEAARSSRDLLHSTLQRHGYKLAGFTKYPDDINDLPSGGEWDEIRQRIFNKRGANVVHQHISA